MNQVVVADSFGRLLVAITTIGLLSSLKKRSTTEDYVLGLIAGGLAAIGQR